MKRKVLLVISLLMLLAAVGFVIYALGHPEGHFPWNNGITYTLYSLYVIGMVACFVASRRRA